MDLLDNPTRNFILNNQKPNWTISRDSLEPILQLRSPAMQGSELIPWSSSQKSNNIILSPLFFFFLNFHYDKLIVTLFLNLLSLRFADEKKWADENIQIEFKKTKSAIFISVQKTCSGNLHLSFKMETPLDLTDKSSLQWQTYLNLVLKWKSIE